jgi:hypothetical protein
MYMALPGSEPGTNQRQGWGISAGVNLLMTKKKHRPYNNWQGIFHAKMAAISHICICLNNCEQLFGLRCPRFKSRRGS